MAAPAKNFTDPTMLMRMMVPHPTPPSPRVRQLVGMAMHWEVKFPDFALNPFVLETTLGQFSPTPYVVKTPTPPLGRMCVNTFPPIYKERPTDGGFDVGQIYPPPAP